ncbi:hypothetical protein HPB47_004358, partial [Ixodes persulcatus]
LCGCWTDELNASNQPSLTLHLDCESDEFVPPGHPSTLGAGRVGDIPWRSGQCFTSYRCTSAFIVSFFTPTRCKLSTPYIDFITPSVRRQTFIGLWPSAFALSESAGFIRARVPTHAESGAACLPQTVVYPVEDQDSLVIHKKTLRRTTRPLIPPPVPTSLEVSPEKKRFRSEELVYECSEHTGCPRHLGSYHVIRLLSLLSLLSRPSPRGGYRAPSLNVPGPSSDLSAPS